MKRIIMMIALLVAVHMVPVTAALAVMPVGEIVNRANLAAYYGGDDGRSEVVMTIKDDQGRTRTREFVILRLDGKDGGPQKFYVYFQKPSDVRKMVFMVHKHLDRDDDRWMYLANLDLVKRIAGSDKRTSFVGSNFFYEDVSGRGTDEDIHELVEETGDNYVLKNVPKKPDEVEFSSYTLWIDKKNFLPVKAEYLDREGRKYRMVEALEIQEIQGIPTVVKSRVKDLASGGETVSEFKNSKYDIGLNDQIFTERYLRRPPREVR